MVFKRREKPPVLSRMREYIAPRRGWRRALEYMGHRIRRLPDTPHRIALGIAAGVFVSFTPFFGFHFLFAFLVARLIQGNVLAALSGTFFGNPLTFPFIASVSLGMGQRMLGHDAKDFSFAQISHAFKQFFLGLWDALLSVFGLAQPDWSKLSVFFDTVWWPYCVGGILPGIAAGAASYFVSRPLIAAYQKRRRSRMLDRAKKAAAARSGVLKTSS